MSLTASTLDAMLLAGATAEMIVAVVKADIAEREAKTSVRRENDACRKREQRDRERASRPECHAESRGQSVTPADSADGAGQGSSRTRVVISNSPSENINIPPLSPKPTRQRGQRLPDDWSPSQGLRDFGIVLGFSERELALEIDGFRDFWRGVPGARGCKLDWDGTFRNRLRDQAGKRARFSPRPQTATPSLAAAKLVLVERDTPEGEAWERHFRETKGKGAPWANGKWHFPSKWPTTQLFNEAAE